ncbi:virulence protein [Lactiplantibacillus pentosus]|uniref:virulence-associated E family protein n=1 Tax=Lactiplantibacillus pentosus TaxID=1589 RepID=UPI001F1BDD6B|nr:virulence-associated E family protein [Lactiplantibacillus pentosus]MCE6029694.1 virulence-associated E family protein [Lactiplantibacillus pentosus]MCT3275733.1 virulence protein [Lactiplantibacillus pentosus]
MGKAMDLPAETREAANNVIKMQRDADWQNDFKKNSDDGIKTQSLYNIRLIMEHDEMLKGLVVFDEFSEQIVKTPQADNSLFKKGFWNDSDDTLLRSYIEDHYNLLFSKENITDAVVTEARRKTINPVKARIEAVEWDGQPRAERYFIDYLGAEDNHYTRTITKKWLTGLIARAYVPGVKFEIVPILEGSQGLGKSTAGKNLYPDKFNDSLKGMGKQKDDYQQLQGSWIIEVAELSAMKKTDIEGIKNFISAQSDTYRNSYGRYALPHPRKCVFIGTTNQTDYLKDATGERRFYPIKCGVNKAKLDVWHPDENYILQVLAEAAYWFRNGEPLYLDQATVKEAKAYQMAAEAVEPMRDAIEEFLAMEVPTDWENMSTSLKQSYVSDYGHHSKWLQDQVSNERKLLNQTTTMEIMEVVFRKTVDRFLTGRTNSEAKRIKLLMDNMDGWEAKRIRINGKQPHGYVRVQ